MNRFLLISAMLLIALQSCRKTDISPAAINADTEYETFAEPGFSVSKAFGDNMVIQRDKPFVIWGNAAPGVTVGVKVSWNTKLFTTKTDNNSTWKITIPAAKATAIPQTIQYGIDIKKPIILKNILIGDVWICAGQSNMGMPVDSIGPWFGYEGVVGYKYEIATANFPAVRLMTVKGDFRPEPIETLRFSAPWKVCNPVNVKDHSAVSYFFGRILNIRLNIPIGLIVSSVGGTDCESWTDKATLESNPILNSFYNGKNRSSLLYNGMIHPLHNMQVKGFIWYQGENNRHNIPVSNYSLLTSSMIKGWRRAFGQGELPFYYTQTTPYAEDFFDSNPWGGDPLLYDYAIFREEQEKIQHMTPNTAMAFTSDVGDTFRIHPKDKRPVGARLAYLALNNTYNQPTPCKGPRYASHTVSGNVATISFVSGTATRLATKDRQPLAQLFFVAGTDKKFRKGNAVISGEKVIVTAPPGTPLPILAIRYGFTNIAITNLGNTQGLPAEIFRTDNWE